MRYALTVLLAFVLVGNANAASYPPSHPWIKKWTKVDRSVYTSINKAAFIFKASPHTMRAIVGGEGGNISPRKLRVTLCKPYAFGSAGGGGLGWNNIGSYAFGPYQYMLDDKPACNGAWGTFGRWDNEAFAAAKKRGFPIPYRFKTPASNLGQSVVTAYMLTHRHTGGLSHWCASMC